MHRPDRYAPDGARHQPHQRRFAQQLGLVLLRRQTELLAQMDPHVRPDKRQAEADRHKFPMKHRVNQPRGRHVDRSRFL